MIEWLKNLFRGFNEPAEESKPDPLLETLREKGFHFNPDKLWWERTWLVATKNGSETSKEVYVKNDEGWKVVMYGNDGDVFFEHKVSESTQE